MSRQCSGEYYLSKKDGSTTRKLSFVFTHTHPHTRKYILKYLESEIKKFQGNFNQDGGVGYRLRWTCMIYTNLQINANQANGKVDHVK